MTTTIAAGGRPLTLLPEKAAFLAGSRTLLVADAHLGKAVTFRALGVPVPHGTTTETLELLSLLVGRWRARRIVFLGDFLHSAHAHAPATLGALARWRRAHAALELVLVRGNHDHRAGDPPLSLGMRVVDEPFEAEGFALCHHPRPRRGAYVLAGHLHPCVGIGGRAFDHLRLPCFWLGDEVGVLPAFGAFTGMHPIRAGASDRVFPIADGAVAALPGRERGTAGDRRAA
ncbi:MAG TPA: ligase-associated DNA damage response endonuclease PdeM [Caldimonas sp.]|nr:ligase-associated DNA damage response endonuclease PdeM [Caldimonas sp.]HEX4233223.1 ligase-associated DNA damage response endonuclease PdeM [Caldimonas sp.]